VKTREILFHRDGDMEAAASALVSAWLREIAELIGEEVAS